MKTTTPSILTVFCLTFLVVSHRVEAVSPEPDGAYPRGNTAEGLKALFSLPEQGGGGGNTAIGSFALQANATGNDNTAVGWSALILNRGGDRNTAVGKDALEKCAGSANVALGSGAGTGLSSGSGNVYIGAGVFEHNDYLTEDNTTRIRNVYASLATQRAVYVDGDNRIGTLSSSRRYKEEIKPMDRASETLFSLNPVTFRYKKEVDPARMLSFGLIAEEVAKTNPDLITRDEQGKPQTVRYEAVNAMLLNEFLKEHKAFVEEHREVQELEANAARQAKQIEALTAGLQKVSAQLEVSKPAPQTAKNTE
jgi:hypothetical protein